MINSPGNWIEIRKLFAGTEAVETESFAREAVSSMNAKRAMTDDGELVINGDLMTWLRLRAVAGEAYADIQSVVDDLNRDLPAHVDVEARTLHASSLDEVRTDLIDWLSAMENASTYTEIGIFVEPDKEARGIRAISAVTRMLPQFEPALLDPDNPVAEFCSRCAHCGHEHPVKIARAVLGLQLTCPDCGRRYDMLCQDLSGSYRHVNQFLTGYDPPTYFPPGHSKVDEMLSIWRSVVGSFRYSFDITGVGGQRDQWQLPEQTESLGNGDCEDTSILLTDRLISRGIEARVALGYLSEEDGTTTGHAWVVARIDGIDYLLESTEHEIADDVVPLVTELGSKYAPHVLFDRETVYFRDGKKGWTPDYWSAREWTPVRYPSAAPIATRTVTETIPMAAWIEAETPTR